MTHKSPPLRIAVVHYHLRGGGVTRVIDHAATAAQSHGHRIVVLIGETPAENPLPDSNAAIRMVDGLGYTTDSTSLSAATFTQAMRTAARDALGGKPDLWHIHNHPLGKNLTLPRFVQDLAKAGDRLLLQIHDFPEDGRPGNYRFLADGLCGGDRKALGRQLYPAGDHIRYAVLNSRDQNFLRQAGAEKDGVLRLANAVCPPPVPEEPDKTLFPGQRLILYPTRAIRRKNIGEFLLWSSVGDPDDLFGATLAPKNPVQQPLYRDWVNFAESLKLPAAFELGQSSPFGALMRRADQIITTSVGEGFGLAFLEPFAIGKPLYGRSLPEVTDEFSEAGVDLASLYPRLDLPEDLIDTQDLRQRIIDALERSFSAYGRHAGLEEKEHAYKAACRDGVIDFGRLDEPLQRKVIGTVHANRSLQPKRLANTPCSQAVLRQNQEAISQHYSLDGYGKHLNSIYLELASRAHSSVSYLDGDYILNRFLAPDRFMLIRT